MTKRAQLTKIRKPERDLRRFFYDAHREAHPWCRYGDTPHFVPPSFRDAGFYMCDADKPEEEL